MRRFTTGCDSPFAYNLWSFLRDTLTPFRPGIIPHKVSTGFQKPMECLSPKKLPTGEQWTYEIKLDGFRVEGFRTQDHVTLYSKQGKLLTGQFMQIALELEKLPLGTALDCELVALHEGGVPRFNLLQNYRSGSAHIMYFAFDVLAYKGEDVSKLPLAKRRELLRTTVQSGPHVDVAAWSNNLEAMEHFAREHKLEGIVAKRSDSRYEPGKRSGSWVKLRFNCRQEFVKSAGTRPANWDSMRFLWASIAVKTFDSPEQSEAGSRRDSAAKFTTPLSTCGQRPLHS
jgi:bifunctional non-homologous end joining protein LigD